MIAANSSTKEKAWPRAPPAHIVEVKKVNPNINLCFQITQEMYIHELREQIENVVVNEWGLKKDNIKFFDANALTNPIDLVFKPYVLNPQYVCTENKEPLDMSQVI